MVRVYAFDVDGTLTPIRSCWRFIHNILNTVHRSRNYSKYFFEGLLSYDEWVAMELNLWKNIDVEVFKRIVYAIPWRNGIEDLVEFRHKKSRDVFIAVSGGFNFLGERAVRELKFNSYIGVELEILNGRLTGYALSYPDFNGKGTELIEYLRSNSIEYSELICIGDNINDIDMFRYCDVSIGFCPSKNLRRDYVNIFINSCSIRNLVNILYTI
ncbi:MAG: HAD-IB family phosphatase [Ignisphaera sp.]